jgi:hypothetical protein
MPIILRALSLRQITRAVRFGIACLLLHPSASYCQLTESTLKGTITDVSGGTVDGATIVATNDETGRTRTVSSGASGDFVIPNIPPGFYSLTVRLPKFKTYEQSYLELNVGKTTKSKSA